ncbi:MAG: PEP/pyruvate-binding domain-containing protein, partial [Sedimentisphaerales bacterium]|nr:PEP/pyruvate-binding domain-containing protein [Sedimentisphaerales bacterium]
DPQVQAETLLGLTDPKIGFDSHTMLRFRSSTNVEDSEQYSGAGLYDSYSGCPADDLDDDSSGPCGCDPCRPSEQGVFRAIRKTFTSFYNENAYLERIKRAVDESKVGMAILVNPSFPDPIELANGVATVEITTDKGQIHLVSQLGATSVTNPTGQAIPEEVILQILSGWALKVPVPSDIKQYSSLVPLGGTVMTFSADYKELGNLLILVSKTFKEVTGKDSFTLDLEYKKVAPGDKTLPNGGIVIKQVREVPQASGDRAVRTFLINQPLTFEVFTGECHLLQDTTDIFAVHRLKSRWHIQTKNMAMDPDSLADGIYQQVSIEFLDGDRVRNVSLDLSSQARHSFDGQILIDTWSMGDRQYQLITPGIRTEVTEAENPIFTLADLGTQGYTPYKVITLDLKYQQQVPAWYQGLWPACLRQTSSSRVYLWQVSPADGNDVIQERTLSRNGITIRTSFYYPALPAGYTTWVGSTAPLKRWRQTVIEGLTSDPIVLEGYYSQSYMPEHHNLVENFLFEPALEPGISQKILDELKAKGIRYIHMIIDQDDRPPDQSTIVTYDFML